VNPTPWGTPPGLNPVDAHLNRITRERDTECRYVFGPGHGGPAAVANAWLEGTWIENHGAVGTDVSGTGGPTTWTGAPVAPTGP
jgi:xylulose-5-phosphate/fructose-6-phosphate phosphoketolase